jgi:WD40 repeat protein
MKRSAAWTAILMVFILSCSFLAAKSQPTPVSPTGIASQSTFSPSPTPPALTATRTASATPIPSPTTQTSPQPTPTLIGGFPGQFVSVKSSNTQRTVSLWNADGVKIKDLLVLPPDPNSPWKVFAWDAVKDFVQLSPAGDELLTVICEDQDATPNQPACNPEIIGLGGTVTITMVPVKVTGWAQWFPDGKTIMGYAGDPARTMRDGNAFIVFDRQGENLRKLKITFGNMNYPLLSPDGKKALSTTNKNETLMINLDGSYYFKISQGLSLYNSLAWSPDGKKIVLVQDLGKGPELFIFNADGTNRKQLTNGADYSEAQPVFSPDGSLILFQSSSSDMVEKNLPISVVAADGSSAVVEVGSGMFPRWSPDGTLIFYDGWPLGAAQNDSDMALYAVHPDGSGLVAIPPNWFGFVEGIWEPGSIPHYTDGRPPEFKNVAH